MEWRVEDMNTIKITEEMRCDVTETQSVVGGWDFKYFKAIDIANEMIKMYKSYSSS